MIPHIKCPKAPMLHFGGSWGLWDSTCNSSLFIPLSQIKFTTHMYPTSVVFISCLSLSSRHKLDSHLTNDWKKMVSVIAVTKHLYEPNMNQNHRLSVVKSACDCT